MQHELVRFQMNRMSTWILDLGKSLTKSYKLLNFNKSWEEQTTQLSTWPKEDVFAKWMAQLT
jgi:hypothetical protein